MYANLDGIEMTLTFHSVPDPVGLSSDYCDIISVVYLLWHSIQPQSMAMACLSCIIIGASVSEAPSCGLDGRAVTIYIYIYTAGTRYYACAALRANVAGRIGNPFSPAESAFLVPSATSLTLAP